MSGWMRAHDLLELEIRQRIEEGCELDVKEWERRRTSAPPDDAAFHQRLMLELQKNEPPAECAFLEPHEWGAIRNQRPASRPATPFAAGERELFDRMLGGWLGRCCGCSLGRPFEREPYTLHPEGRERGEIERWLRGADALPLTGYVPQRSRAEQRGLSLANPASTAEGLRAMEVDENLTGMVANLLAAEEFGLDMRTEDYGRAWSKFLAWEQLTPAQTQSFANLLWEDDFSRNLWDKRFESRCNWPKIATRNNPFREWALARTDFQGLARPGDPEGAAERAWIDGRLSHTKNGLFSGMFFAAMIAAAFTARDALSIVEAGLGQIPADCRLAHAVLEALNLAGRRAECGECWDELRADFTGLHRHHAIPNAVICVLALLCGEGDFGKSIVQAVGLGRNPAANGASVGTIMGVFHGARALPGAWTKPLANTLKTDIRGQARGTIADVARRCVALLKPVLY